MPALPDVGPCTRLDGPACCISLNHIRPRSTGPCFPVSVVRCATHGVAFTLYPPGHVPYGRKAIGSTAPAEGMTGAGTFVGTMFDASLDAAQGHPWSRESPGGSDKWWGTQGQHLQVATHLCGVAPEINKTLREMLASALKVRTLLLLEGSADVAAKPGYRSRGRAVGAVLEQLPSGPCAIERLSVAGHLIGYWGTPYVWDPGISRLRQLDFERFSPELRERAKAHPPPSTKAGRVQLKTEAIGSPPSNERTLANDFVASASTNALG